MVLLVAKDSVASAIVLGIHSILIKLYSKHEIWIFVLYHVTVHVRDIMSIARSWMAVRLAGPLV